MEHRQVADDTEVLDQILVGLVSEFRSTLCCVSFVVKR